MYFRTMGKSLPAPTVVCIPGLLGGAEDFNSIVDPLLEKFHIIIQDPNYQRREQEGLNLSVDSMQDLEFKSSADDIAEFLKKNNIRSAYFIGISIGGKIVYDFSCKFPQMIQGALITDISPDPFSDTELFQFIHEAVDKTPLHLPWADVKKYLQETIKDRSLRTLIQSQVSYPDQKLPGRWKNGMANLEITLQRQSLNYQFEAFEKMDSVLERQKTRFKILKSKEFSGISAEALVRLKRLKCVEILPIDVSTHFLHITHKGLIVEQLLELAQLN